MVWKWIYPKNSEENMAFLETSNTGITVILALLAMYIAYYIERKYKARIQFHLEANCFAAQQGYYIVEVVVIINNKGLVRHVIDTLDLKIFGIKPGKNIELRKKEGIHSAVNFPELFVDANILKNKGKLFIEPGVVQQITYIARIPEDIRLIFVKSSFKYHKNSTHSAQKIFELSGECKSPDKIISR